MAKIESLSQLLTTGGMDFLAEVYAGVIDNIQKTTLSARLKSQEMSGNPRGGTVTVKRFTNTRSKPYGTARISRVGQFNEVQDVTLKIDIDRELIHEVEQKDVSLYGVEDLIRRKASQDEGSMRRELEREFFATAVMGATRKDTFVATNEIDKFEEIVQLIETTQNDFVDGVPRDMIAVVMSPDQYGKLRTFLDVDTHNANVNTAAEGIQRIHGVEVYSSTYLPSGVKMIAMVKGSVGQMVLVNLDEPNKFDASNAWHFGLFYSYGNASVMPDLTYYVAVGATNLGLTAKDSETPGSTDITVNFTGVGKIAKYCYKDNTEEALPIGAEVAGAGYTEKDLKDGVMTVPTTNGNMVAIVAVDAEGKVVAGNVVKSVVE